MAVAGPTVHPRLGSRFAKCVLTSGDLSLFQLGLRLLEHLLNEGKRIPVSFQPIVV